MDAAGVDCKMLDVKAVEDAARVVDELSDVGVDDAPS